MTIDDIDDIDDITKGNIAELWAQMQIAVQAPAVTEADIQKAKAISGVARTALAEIQSASRQLKRKMPEMSQDGQEASSSNAKVRRSAESTRVLSGKRKLTSIFEKETSTPEKLTNTRAAFNILQRAAEKVQGAQDRIEDLSVDEIAENMKTSLSDILADAHQELKRKDPQFPNVAWEIVKLGLQKEETGIKKLEKYKEEADAHQLQVKKFLRFSTKLDALSHDAATHNLKEAILDKLTGPEREEFEECIEKVFPKDSYDISKISKEQLAGAKVRVSDMMSHHKTEMTNLLSTKISLLAHVLQSMISSIQMVLRALEKLYGTISRNSGKM